MLAAPPTQPATLADANATHPAPFTPIYPLVPGCLHNLECSYCWYAVFQRYNQAWVNYPKSWSSTICPAHVAWQIRRRRLTKIQTKPLAQSQSQIQRTVLLFKRIWLSFAISRRGAYILGIWAWLTLWYSRLQNKRAEERLQEEMTQYAIGFLVSVPEEGEHRS